MASQQHRETRTNFQIFTILAANPPDFRNANVKQHEFLPVPLAMVKENLPRIWLVDFEVSTEWMVVT